MTKEEFKNLSRGDIIRHKDKTQSALVDVTFGDRVTAVQTIDVTNPEEWDIVCKAGYY